MNFQNVDNMDWLKNIVKKPDLVLRIEVLTDKGKSLMKKDLSNHYVAHFIALKGEWPLNKTFKDMIDSNEEIKNKFIISEQEFISMQKTLFENSKNIEDV